MPLSSSQLEAALKDLQNKKRNSVPSAAQAWAKAIHSYSAAALATPASPVLNYGLLQSKILASMQSQKFIDNLGRDLLQYWVAATWVGPSVTGVTLPPPVWASSVLGKSLNSKNLSGDDVARQIATEIHRWTKTIKVTVTNTITGVIVVTPVI